VAEAVLDHLAGMIPAIITTSRKLRHFSEVAPPEQPALFMSQASQDVEQEKGVPPKWIYNYKLWLYAHADNPDDIPSSIQNALLDAIEAAFAPDDIITHCLTLGGTVSHCWIEGEVEMDEGLLGQQTVAVIPVRVLVP
jgi:hypothetical protein